VIQSLGALTQYRRVADRETDRRTNDNSVYRAGIASRGKNVRQIPKSGEAVRVTDESVKKVK